VDSAGFFFVSPGSAWYRKHFTVPSDLEGHLIWLQFDGVYRAADFFVNGAFVAHHEEGYTSVIVNIHNASEPLRYGAENVMTVFVDGTQSELWAYEGNGIYRHVWIESAPLVSITLGPFTRLRTYRAQSLGRTQASHSLPTARFSSLKSTSKMRALGLLSAL
jgi:beta-galactosidase/beta-glucuronidase